MSKTINEQHTAEGNQFVINGKQTDPFKNFLLFHVVLTLLNTVTTLVPVRRLHD